MKDSKAFILICSVAAAVLLWPGLATESCDFLTAQEVHAAANKCEIIIDPKLEDGVAIIDLSSTNSQDCFTADAFLRVKEERCSVEAIGLGNNSLEATVKEADLLDCGSEPILSEDRSFIIFHAEVVYELYFEGTLVRVFVRALQFIRNRLTTAVTGIFTPIEERGPAINITDRSIISATLTTCVDRDCEDTSAIVYREGDRLYGKLEVELSGMGAIVRGVQLGEYGSIRDIDITGSLADERTVDGGVLFSVVVKECHNCFLRVIGDVVPLDGSSTSRRRILQTDTGDKFKAAAYTDIVVHQDGQKSEDEGTDDDDGSLRDGLILGLALGGGTVFIIAVAAIAIIAVKKKSKRSSQKNSKAGDNRAQQIDL